MKCNRRSLRWGRSTRCGNGFSSGLGILGRLRALLLQGESWDDDGDFGQA